MHGKSLHNIKIIQIFHTLPQKCQAFYTMLQTCLYEENIFPLLGFIKIYLFDFMVERRISKKFRCFHLPFERQQPNKFKLPRSYISLKAINLIG